MALEVSQVLAKREVRSTLQTLSQSGATAVYISADITDEANLKRQLDQVQRQVGPITGVIHGAGVLADKLIEDKTAADFDAVFGPKIAGLRAILASVDANRLHHLVLFSSIAGFYGNRGQTDYAMANEVLNKIALRVRAMNPRCRVISFNWGPWDGGMVTEELKNMFKARNIGIIPADQGAQLFSELTVSGRIREVIYVVGDSLAELPAQVVAAAEVPARALQPHIFSRSLSLSANPYLRDHVIGGNPVLPVVSAVHWMASECETLFPGYVFHRCENFRLFKGVVFEGCNEITFQLVAHPVGHSGAEVQVDTAVSSPNDRGGLFNRYRALITLVRARPAPQIYRDFQLDAERAIAGRELYSSGILFHGPQFQAIRSVLNYTESRITLQCVEKTPPPDQQGQFPVGSFNPFVADVQFQGILVWVSLFHDGAASLPADGGEMIVYRPVPAGADYFVSIDIVSSTKTRVVTNIYVHDSEGWLYTCLAGAAVSVSRELRGMFTAA
jgi:NAD(P)-dependent dehydrogenase (short-subunit alcohol dehydrogenase family)